MFSGSKACGLPRVCREFNPHLCVISMPCPSRASQLGGYRTLENTAWHDRPRRIQSPPGTEGFGSRFPPGGWERASDLLAGT